MSPKESSEKFQPIMRAFFDVPQLRKIFAWGINNNIGRIPLDSALETAGVDEDGNKMNDESKIRLKYGVTALKELIKNKISPDQVINVQVWQETPDDRHVAVKVMIGPM